MCIIALENHWIMDLTIWQCYQMSSVWLEFDCVSRCHVWTSCELELRIMTGKEVPGIGGSQSTGGSYMCIICDVCLSCYWQTLKGKLTSSMRWVFWSFPVVIFDWLEVDFAVALFSILCFRCRALWLSFFFSFLHFSCSLVLMIASSWFLPEISASVSSENRTSLSMIRELAR